MKHLISMLLAFICVTGEIIQEGDSIADLISNDCQPVYKYGERYYQEHWLYEGKNGFTYEVTVEQGQVINITNEGR